ncbi:hypothetical protein OBBRIDRAFT_804947 [Obba rivulosa]|uniref:Uncharacterized protein n=1 Tax=Obba rivulosa TaxID=1052685 RepID=A0A8E2AVY4_9APHY|nr:hypothetical protein OBBRIDRAFT_804947 [Obba rivulosa]
MPSLAAVVSAIVGGCVLLTLILSYAIWSIRCDQAQIQRQRHSQQRADRYTLQLFERNQRRAQRDRVESPECIPYSYPPVPSTSSLPRPKPTRLRTPPLLYETCPFSEEVCIAFPSSLNEDAHPPILLSALAYHYGTIAKVQHKIDVGASTYRFAQLTLQWLALYLDKPETWKDTLQELKPEDIRGISTGEMFETKGHRTMSWIWKVSGVSKSTCNDDSNPDLHEEECDLIEEEMCHVMQFHEWQRSEWLKLANSLSTEGSANFVEGMVANRTVRQTSGRPCTKSAQSLGGTFLVDEEEEDTLSHLEDQDVAKDPELSD